MSLTLLQAVSAINDANMLITTLAPLVQQAVASGQTEITDADVDASRERSGSSIEALGVLIARVRAEGG